MTCSYKLGEVHREYEAISKSDGKLNPERDGSGGFGGIGILWHLGNWCSTHLSDQLG